MSTIKRGTHPLPLPDPSTMPTLVDMVTDEGAYHGSRYVDILPEYEDVADEPVHGMSWSVEADEGDELEVSLSIEEYLELRGKAKAYDMHMRTCSDNCQVHDKS